LALIGDSVGQSASAPALSKASGKLLASTETKVKGISAYGFLTYLLLLCVFLTDTADLSMIGKLVGTVVLDAPASHAHSALALLVFIPAIAASFLWNYFSTPLGRLQSLSFSALVRCIVIATFVLAIKFVDFSCWQSFSCIAILSFLSAYAFVPRLCWMIDMRKSSLAGCFQLVLFGFALFSSIALVKQEISTVALCQIALTSSALAALGFRLMQGKQESIRASVGASARASNRLSRHAFYLIATKSFTVLIGLAIWSCLALTSIEQYQISENSLLNFAALSCLGIVAGAGLALAKLKRSLSFRLAYIFRVLSTLVLIVFGFFGNYLAPLAFIFVFTGLWSASYTCELSWPKGTIQKNKRLSSANLERFMGWGQAIVLTTILLICLATCTGIDTISSALQLRKFALASGIVSLVSLAFASRAFARRLNML
jgi:hypothetical protein